MNNHISKPSLDRPAEGENFYNCLLRHRRYAIKVCGYHRLYALRHDAGGGGASVGLAAIIYTHTASGRTVGDPVRNGATKTPLFKPQNLPRPVDTALRQKIHSSGRGKYTSDRNSIGQYKPDQHADNQPACISGCIAHAHRSAIRSRCVRSMILRRSAVMAALKYACCARPHAFDVGLTVLVRPAEALIVWIESGGLKYNS